MPAAGIDGSFIRPRTNLEVGLEPTEGFDQGTHQHLLISHNHQPIWRLIKKRRRDNEKISLFSKVLIEACTMC